MECGLWMDGLDIDGIEFQIQLIYNRIFIKRFLRGASATPQKVFI